MNKLSHRLGLAAAAVIVASAFGCANQGMSSQASAKDSTTTAANATTYDSSAGGVGRNPMNTGAVSGGGIIANTAPPANTMSSGTSSAMSNSSTTVASTTPTSVDADRSQTAAAMPAPMATRPARADRN